MPIGVPSSTNHRFGVPRSAQTKMGVPTSIFAHKSAPSFSLDKKAKMNNKHHEEMTKIIAKFEKSV